MGICCIVIMPEFRINIIQPKSQNSQWNIWFHIPVLFIFICKFPEFFLVWNTSCLIVFKCNINSVTCNIAMKYYGCINDDNRRYYKSMYSLDRKLSNLEKLRRYLGYTIPDIYDQKVASLIQQSSIYHRYTGLCCSILKESVIAENGFREYGKIQSDSEKKISFPDPDEFIEISHDTLERISSGLNEESLVFFSSFYKKLPAHHFYSLSRNKTLPRT